MSLLDNLAAISAGVPLVYEDPKFLMSFKHHVDQFANGANIFNMPIDAHLAHRYKGDFRGLIKAMGITEKYLGLISILNGIDDSTQFNGELATLTLLDDDALEGLAEQFRAQNK